MSPSPQRQDDPDAFALSKTGTQTLRRIEALEQMLDHLTRSGNYVIDPVNMAAGQEIVEYLHKVRAVSALVRSFRHCLDMRAELMAQETYRAQIRETTPPVDAPGETEAGAVAAAPPSKTPPTPVEKIKKDLDAARALTGAMKKNIMRDASHQIRDYPAARSLANPAEDQNSPHLKAPGAPPPGFSD